jgi:hypothetical protein
VVAEDADRCLDTLAGTKAMKRAVVTIEAPAGPILLSLYADCGSQQGLKLSPRVVAVARKPNDETNEV